MSGRRGRPVVAPAWARARVWRHALAVLAVLALAGCDLGGPSGPVTIAGTVTGHAALGAAVIELGWDGVTGFDGRGGTQVYSGAVSGAQNRHRLILLQSAGGDLQFAIGLEEANLYAPVMTVVSAVDAGNEPIPVADLRIVLER